MLIGRRFIMKKYGASPSVIKLVTLSLALSTSICLAQTHDAQNPASHQSTGLAGRDTSTTSANLGAGRTAKDLMHDNVESKNGDKLGSVKDMVIDTRSGRVDYIVISSGGVAGVGSHLKAVPPSALSLGTTKKNTLALDVTPEQWKAAPDFDKKNLASLGDQAQGQQIYQFYKQQWPAVAAQAPATPALPPTGRDSGIRGQTSRQLQLASDLIGKNVVNRQGQDVGKISDLLVDISSPKVAFAILKPGSVITDADKQASHQLFAIAINSLNTMSGDNKIVLDIAPAQFQSAQNFDATSWTDAGAATGTANVFRYQGRDNDAYSKEPDNTRRNVRDRDSGALTPTKQSESKEDLQLTQNIRRSIVKDDGLSTLAKNVKIISANGKVVLRGPVHSEQEKNEIARLAEQTAGVGNVENHLEITHD
ncbi:MAG: PRC-barrel domain protein [Pedosphaera sp.]|nr:PRC-barrel domain protein [Pedosphaera sp.]